jgi:hypothetical protein
MISGYPSCMLELVMRAVCAGSQRTLAQHAHCAVQCKLCAYSTHCILSHMRLHLYTQVHFYTDTLVLHAINCYMLYAMLL